MIVREKVITYEVREVSEDDLMTLAEAARVLGVTIPGVVGAINRGVLREIINENTNNPTNGRRLVYREDVAKLARARTRKSWSAD